MAVILINFYNSECQKWSWKGLVCRFRVLYIASGRTQVEKVSWQVHYKQYLNKWTIRPIRVTYSRDLWFLIFIYFANVRVYLLPTVPKLINWIGRQHIWSIYHRIVINACSFPCSPIVLLPSWCSSWVQHGNIIHHWSYQGSPYPLERAPIFTRDISPSVDCFQWTFVEFGIFLWT